jgi:hypothetical protein
MHIPPSLADIHCTCVSLSASSSSPCASLPHPRSPLTWPAAHALAVDHAIPLHFATRTTIEHVLAIPAPLPTSVLLVAGQGPSRALEGARDEVVCGFAAGSGDDGEAAEGVDGFVGMVVAWLMVLVAVYLLGEWVVRRLRLGGRARGVVLGGAEKRLRV